MFRFGSASGIFASLFGVTGAALMLMAGLSASLAQSSAPQPDRNDAQPSAPNHSAKDTVPPATDSSLPTRGGKQEPSSKIGDTSAGPVFADGMLNVPGAQPDSQTAPAKFSKRSDEADQLPIAAYALRHLSQEQRDRIEQALRRQALSGAPRGQEFDAVGAEIPSSAMLAETEPVPHQLVAELPELKDLRVVRSGQRILLVSATLHRILAILE